MNIQITSRNFRAPLSLQNELNKEIHALEDISSDIRHAAVILEAREEERLVGISLDFGSESVRVRQRDRNIRTAADLAFHDVKVALKNYLSLRASRSDVESPHLLLH